MYVVGTAGHVDHGKSTLVQALTGIDPDRLAEEKERGMTIDLGFAWLTLPSGREISIVDVPGHERFIKNMLAGVGGIDLALLVIAADEGVMPQTEEHLSILELLRVRRAIVALTKIDLVDAAGAGEHVLDEALVARDVDDADFTARRQRQPGEAEVDSEAALLLLTKAIGVDAGERADERALAVVDVAGGADDEHVASLQFTVVGSQSPGRPGTVNCKPRTVHSLP